MRRDISSTNRTFPNCCHLLLNCCLQATFCVFYLSHSVLAQTWAQFYPEEEIQRQHSKLLLLFNALTDSRYTFKLNQKAQQLTRWPHFAPAIFNLPLFDTLKFNEDRSEGGRKIRRSLKISAIYTARIFSVKRAIFRYKSTRSQPRSKVMTD